MPQCRSRPDGLVSRSLPVLLALFAVVATQSPLVDGAVARAAGRDGTVDSFAFRPVADTSVNEAAPTTAYGQNLDWVDASPVRETFLMFRVRGLSGRTIVGAHLRMNDGDASSSGGRVFPISSNAWNEQTTWSTRPTIDGPEVASFASVQPDTWYEADLSSFSFIPTRGVVSLALDSTSTDAVAWNNREGAVPPELIVDVAPVAGLTLDGVSTVASAFEGSTYPVAFSSQHRLAVTSGGRLLTVYGLHTMGVQLAWRDPGAGWMQSTTGAVTDGRLLNGTGTGDWAASIAVADDATGEEHAWVVWASVYAGGATRLELRRLSALDAAGGPSVGPAESVAGAGAAPTSRPDVAFERDASGGVIGACVTWVEQTVDGSWSVEAAWITDLSSDAPAVHDATSLLIAPSGAAAPTVAPTPSGVVVVVRNAGGNVQAFMHDAADAPTEWGAGPSGIPTAWDSYPSAVALASGDLLVAIEDATDHVSVVRYSAASPTWASSLQLAGYAEPSVATDGARAWVVMVRRSDDAVVSRRIGANGSWTASDRLEVAATAAGGNAGWPNALRQTDGRLRFVLRGAAGAGDQNAVLASQRTV